MPLYSELLKKIQLIGKNSSQPETKQSAMHVMTQILAENCSQENK